MFALPAHGTQAREMMGDVAHLAEVLDPSRRLDLPTFAQALIRGRRFMETAGNAASRVSVVCYGNCNKRNQNGKIVLVSIGRRGGWKLEWVFGDAT